MPSDVLETTAWIRSLLAEHESALVRYATRLVRDSDLARDVVQDVFLRLISADPATVRDHATEWLFTVCRNRCLDVVRKEQRMTTMGETAERSIVDEPARTMTEPDSAESTAGILQLLEALPERQQEVIRLKFQNGLSYREISRVTQLTVTNVGVLIHLGLKSIRERVAARNAIEATARLGATR